MYDPADYVVDYDDNEEQFSREELDDMRACDYVDAYMQGDFSYEN